MSSVNPHIHVGSVVRFFVADPIYQGVVEDIAPQGLYLHQCVKKRRWDDDWQPLDHPRMFVGWGAAVLNIVEETNANWNYI
jgi:hypothetical protein